MTNPAYAKCYPYEAVQQAGESEWRHLAGAWGDGILSGFGVTASASNRNLTISLGELRLRGIHFEGTDPTLVIAVPAVAGGYTRWDRLVAKNDPSDKSITIIIKQGTAVSSGTPVAPALQQDSGGVWEMLLYDVVGGNVAANALTITDRKQWVLPILFRYGVSPLPDPADYGYAQPLVQDNPPSTSMTDLLLRRGGTGTEQWIGLVSPHGSGTEDFTNISLANGMSTYDNTPYWTRSAGKMHAGGTVKRTSGADFVANTVYTICTFSGGNMPRKEVVIASAMSFNGADASGRVRIGLDGVVQFRPASNTPWFSLDGLSWFPKGL